MFYHRHFRPFGFGFGFRPFGFCFHGFWTHATRTDYMKWLEEYKKELEDELKAVEKEIEKLRKED